MYWQWLYIYLFFFLFCTHFHPDGGSGDITFTIHYRLHLNFTVTDLRSYTRHLLVSGQRKFLSRRLGASLLCKDSDSGLAEQTKMNISGRVNIFIFSLTFWRRNVFFLILAHPVYKMWIIQEPNTLELWSKLHFEWKKRRVYTMFKIFSTYICWINI